MELSILAQIEACADVTFTPRDEASREQAVL